MKIKVKVKTLILVSLGVLFFIFGIVPFANMELADYLSNKKPEIAEKLYDNYIRYPSSLRKDEALYKQAENIMQVFGRYNIMQGGKTWNKLLDYASVTKAIESNEKIVKDYPKSDYYSKAYMSVMDIYIYLGDVDSLHNWIDWGISKGREDIRNIAYLYKAYGYYADRKYQSAEEILNSFSMDNEELNYIYYFIKGHIALAKEDFQKAKEYYKKANNIDLRNRRDNLFGSTVHFDREAWLNKMNFSKGGKRIRGRVTADGGGIPFVEVYLKYPNEGYSSGGGQLVAITDKNGYYETVGMKKGRYEIGIGISTPMLFDKVYLDRKVRFLDVSDDMEFDFELVTPMTIISPGPGELVKDNKFVVEWKEVDGADYYTVFSVGFEEPENMKGSSMTFALVDENREYNIRGNKAVLDIEVLRNEGLGSSFRTSDEIINPTSIIGYFYDGIEMPVIVEAYDSDGNKLNSSIPLATYYNNTSSIKIETGDLTEGEKLILDKKYEEAIEHYENILVKDENNMEALFYLTRFNMVDWKKDKKNILKALDYGKGYYSVTGDTKLIFKLLLEAESDEYREYKDSIAELLSMIPEENMTSDLYWIMGEYHSALGEFQQAKENLILANYPHLNPKIIYIDLILGENEKGLKRLRNEDIKFDYMSKEKLVEGIEILNTLDKNNEEYLGFKEFLSKLIKREEDYNKRREDFEKIYNTVKNKGIKIILNEIKADNHWD